jgi:hypothetical protein
VCDYDVRWSWKKIFQLFGRKEKKKRILRYSLCPLVWACLNGFYPQFFPWNAFGAFAASCITHGGAVHFSTAYLFKQFNLHRNLTIIFVVNCMVMYV